MTAIVVQANARQLPLRDESVDLFVTSPPYFLLRSYQDDGEHYAGQIGMEDTAQGFIDSLIECTAEMVRCLKPKGSIFVNLNDKYSGSGGPGGDYLKGGLKETQPRDSKQISGSRNTHKSSGIPKQSLMLLPERYRIAAVDQLGLIARAVLIWDKPNGIPESVRRRASRSHEDWVHLVKRQDAFANIDPLREPHQPETMRRSQYPAKLTDYRKEASAVRGGNKTYSGPHPDGRVPGSVWRIAYERLRIPEAIIESRALPRHFAAFPSEWPRRLILGWSPSEVCARCNEGRERGACACEKHDAPTSPAIVADPFGGTGTTAMVARQLGRIGLSFDLSHDYSRLARWRVFESGHGVRALARSAQQRQGRML